MLQDLWVPFTSVVAGDHAVHNGKFHKVLKSCFYTHEDGRVDCNTWVLRLKDDSYDFGWFELMLTTYSKDNGNIRVRPCATSGHCEE